MFEETTPTATSLVRRRRVTAMIAAVITALFGSGLVAIVLIQPVSATTVPGPPAGWSTVFSDSFAGSARLCRQLG